LELILDENTPETVISDTRRFKQVLINLISNSLKFTTQGSITIRIGFDPITNMIRAVVQDTGVGINKNELTQLFKLFGKLQSTLHQNKSGIGLGLNICKQIVQAFDGEIHCES
jgi:signal transduction histidine kinase